MKQASFKERYGPWALVTGGASGIGAEFGRQLAERGLNLALADVQTGMMKKHAEMLKEKFSVEVITITVDLAGQSFLNKIQKATAKLEIGLLVNNAAWGTAGEFMKTDPDEMLLTIAVNCRAPMMLAREFGPLMMNRGKGGMIFLSSASAVQVTPVLANYAATKAYNLVLAEALWDELRFYGVDALALCPGATNTPAFRKSGARIENLSGMPFMEPSEVVAEALESLGKKPSLIPGTLNRIAAFVMARLMTRRKAVAFSGKNMRKLFPES